MVEPLSVMGHSLDIQASIGVVLESPSSERPVPQPEDLLRRADHAMLKAKSQPGFSVYVSVPGAEKTAREDTPTVLEREERLRQALESGALRPAYQPLVTLDTGRTVGVEALAR